MADWRLLSTKLALANGKIINAKKAEIIKEELLADGKIDKSEFEFLLALRRQAHSVDAELDALIFNVIKPILLKDGYISRDETVWLQGLFLSHAKHDERERQFLRDLKASSSQHSEEFLAWCDSLGISDGKTQDSRHKKRRGLARHLLATMKSEKKWRQASVFGLVLLFLIPGSVGVWAFVHSKKPVPIAPTPIVPKEDHVLVSAKLNGEVVREMDAPASPEAVVFEKILVLRLKPGTNDAEFIEQNHFKTSDRDVLMWLTLIKHEPEQQALPSLAINGDVNGRTIDFGTIRAVKENTKEYPATLKKNGQNPIRLTINNPSKETVSVQLRLSWRDNPASVDLYILAVGVSKYANDSPDHKLNLNYASNDAKELMEALQGQANGLFHEVHSTLLLNEQATRAAIVKALQNIRSQAGEHDLVVLVFAGHGAMHKVNEHFHFLPHDFDPNPDQPLELTAVSWQNMETYVDNMPCRVVVVMDACHSGAINLGDVRGDEVSTKELQAAMQQFTNAEQKHGVALIAACGKNEKARENEAWDGHGALTKCLLDCLHQEKGIISLESLRHFAEVNVPKLAGNDQALVVKQSGNVSMTRIPIALGAKKP